ncbi:hypothetical protein SeLEV6574_g06775 [Synchytrium endobioticum]|nr:hypothetical protein SeLEV6574_g06775 [Synchytrium endobioticum]
MSAKQLVDRAMHRFETEYSREFVNWDSIMSKSPSPLGRDMHAVSVTTAPAAAASTGTKPIVVQTTETQSSPCIESTIQPTIATRSGITKTSPSRTVTVPSTNITTRAKVPTVSSDHQPVTAVTATVPSLQKVAFELLPPAGISEKQAHVQYEKRHYRPILFAKDDVQLSMEASETEMKRLVAHAAETVQMAPERRFVTDKAPHEHSSNVLGTTVQQPNMFQLAQDLLKSVRERRSV